MADTHSVDYDYYYARQLNALGREVQDVLAQKTIAIIGCGGLGSHILQTLGTIGLKKIILIDGDTVNLSNLHRQTLYTLADDGAFKAQRAAEFWQARNPFTQFEPHARFLTLENVDEYISGVDVIVDAADSYKCSQLLNVYSIQKNIPIVLANVEQTSGMIGCFAGGHEGQPCYTCLFPEFPQNVANCNEAGVDPRAVALVANFQADMVIEALLKPENTVGKIMKCGSGLSRIITLKLSKQASCLTCSNPDQLKEKMMTNCGFEIVDDIPEGFTFIDVRTLEEFSQSPRDAINVPLDQLMDSPDKLPEGNIVLCCVSGMRSRRAAEFLKEIGREGDICLLNQR